jgi:malonyl-CoA decarboxylase
MLPIQSFLANADGGDAALQSLDSALRAQLQAWFALGFVQLRRLTWDTTPADILERVRRRASLTFRSVRARKALKEGGGGRGQVMQYEAVHAIQSWPELKQRLVGPQRCGVRGAPPPFYVCARASGMTRARGHNRACFGFFHPSLPAVPLVFVEVALTDHVATSVQALLAEPPPAHPYAAATATTTATPPPPTHAVFYAITSTQPGLTGVDLGNLLIKRVAHELTAAHPSLSTFVTLSPLPGLRRWLQVRGEAGGIEPLLLPNEVAWLAQVRQGTPPARALLQLLEGPWGEDAAVTAAVRPLLLRLGAHYLAREKKRGQALDPVANFHLRNGAVLWQLNWRADVSAKGLAQSAGLMVNYRYVLSEVDAHHRQYAADGTIAVGPAVRALLGNS